MEIKVNEDIGLTYVIKQQLIADGEDTSNLNKFSVWSQILELCDEQNTENKNNNEESLYDGGNDKTRSGWGNSYKVYVGKVLKFSDDIWNKIKELAAGGDDETVSTSQSQNSSSNTSARKFSTADIKVSVTNDYKSEDYADESIIKLKQALQGQTTSELKLGDNVFNIFDDMSSEALAYFLDKCPNAIDLICGNSMISQQAATADVYKYIMLPLAERADELGIKLKTTAVRDAELRKDNLNAMKNQILYLKGWIIKKEKEIVQKEFDKANNILIKFANMNPKPEIEYDHKNNYASIRFDDMELDIHYDKNGHIDEVNISDNTGHLARYTKDEASVIPPRMGAYQINAGYDFEKIKAVAEHIFGKNLS